MASRLGVRRCGLRREPVVGGRHSNLTSKIEGQIPKKESVLKE